MIVIELQHSVVDGSDGRATTFVPLGTAPVHLPSTSRTSVITIIANNQNAINSPPPTGTCEIHYGIIGLVNRNVDEECNLSRDGGDQLDKLTLTLNSIG